MFAINKKEHEGEKSYFLNIFFQRCLHILLCVVCTYIRSGVCISADPYRSFIIAAATVASIWEAAHLFHPPISRGFKSLPEPLHPIISHHFTRHSRSSGLFLFTAPNNPPGRLPALTGQEHNGCSANSAGRRRRWTHPRLWEISSADNTNTYWLEVFSLSLLTAVK